MLLKAITVLRMQRSIIYLITEEFQEEISSLCLGGEENPPKL